MKQAVLIFVQATLLAACSHWPPQSDALDSVAITVAPPGLLPQDQVLIAPNLKAEAAGAALSAQAAALHALARGL
jgi:hypothetical protein